MATDLELAQPRSRPFYETHGQSRVAAGQNRGLVYEAKRDLVFLVVGAGGDQGKALVYALRYRHAEAKLFTK